MRRASPDCFSDCRNLSELCERMNYHFDHARFYYAMVNKNTLEDMFDVDSLPVYSNNPIKGDGIYSCDDDWVIRFDDWGFYMDKRGLDYPQEEQQ